jgi:AcrR family transcriptional regulator
MVDRRERILDAALLCCWQKSWNQTSLRDVADAAGLSKGGLYVHFRTKTDLLKSILQRNRERIELLGTAPDLETFIQWNLDNMTFVVGPGGRERAIAQHELQLEGLRTPELRPIVEELVRDTVRVLQVMVQRLRPKLDAAAAEDRATTILCFLEGLRGYSAIASDASLEQLQRLAAGELRAIMDRGGD